MMINQNPILIKQHRIIGMLFLLPCLLTLCLLQLFVANQSAALDLPQTSFHKTAVAASGLFNSASEHTPEKKSQILILDGSPEGLPQPATLIHAVMDTLRKNGFSLNNLFQYLSSHHNFIWVNPRLGLGILSECSASRQCPVLCE
jgi:hypothetical protein